MIDEGKAVPMFELSDADGNIVKIKDFKGKKFVVYFYPKDFTPGCTVEADQHPTCRGHPRDPCGCGQRAPLGSGDARIW